MKNRKILYFVTAKSGFTYNNYISIARRMQCRGAKVYVMCRYDSDDDVFKKSGFRVFSFNRYSFWKVLRIYRRLRPDLVHHIGLHAVLYGLLACLFVRPGKVFNTFLGIYGIPKGWWRRLFFRHMLRPANTFLITENEEDWREALDLGLISADRLCVLPGYGLDAGKILPLPQPKGRMTFALADLIRWDRGVGEFVKAAERIKEKGDMDAGFIISGYAEAAGASDIPSTTLRRWADGEAVKWWGHIRYPAKIWNSAHVGVFPAYRNGLSIATAIAAASGRALIVSDCPGNNVFFEDGKNALVVPVRDPGAVADAMYRLYGDEELRLRLSAAARELALEKFSQERYLDLQEEIYKK